MVLVKIIVPYVGVGQHENVLFDFFMAKNQSPWVSGNTAIFYVRLILQISRSALPLLEFLSF